MLSLHFLRKQVQGYPLILLAGFWPFQTPPTPLVSQSLTPSPHVLVDQNIPIKVLDFDIECTNMQQGSMINM